MPRRPVRDKSPRRSPARPPRPVPENDVWHLERIERVSQNARTTWFGLLAVLVFVGVTLTGHRDVDFFSPAASTQLPVVNVTVPTLNFFSAAPVLVAALYAYLHVYLINLWEALGDAPARVGGHALAERVYPSLLGQAALWWRSRSRRDGSASRGSIGRAACAAAFLLVWVFGLVILFLLWSISTVRHDIWLTLWILGWLALAAMAAIAGLRIARRRMEDPDYEESPWPPALRRNAGFALVVMAFFSWLFTEGPEDLIRGAARATGLHPATEPAAWRDEDGSRRAPFHERLAALARWPLPAAQMPAARLAERPSGWTPYGLWVEDFEDAFRKRHDLKPRHPDNPMPDSHRAVFETERDQRYRHYLSGLPRTPLARVDLRAANLSGAFLARGDLRESRLQGAVLLQAEMQGADLSLAKMQGAEFTGAEMQGADLSLAKMQGADLTWAEMQGADLEEAEMQGADLTWAKMQGADLTWAEMQGADLTRAEMQGADLRRAKMQGAVLRGAEMQGAEASSADFSGSLLASGDLTGVRNLTQAQIDAAVGDRSTILPRDGESGAQLHVWSCWAEPQDGFDALMAAIEKIRRPFRPGGMSMEQIRASLLCNGRPRYRTGRPEPRHHCPPTCARP